MIPKSRQKRNRRLRTMTLRKLVALKRLVISIIKEKKGKK